MIRCCSCSVMFWVGRSCANGGANCSLLLGGSVLPEVVGVAGDCSPWGHVSSQDRRRYRTLEIWITGNETAKLVVGIFRFGLIEFFKLSKTLTSYHVRNLTVTGTLRDVMRRRRHEHLTSDLNESCFTAGLFTDSEWNECALLQLKLCCFVIFRLFSKR